MKKSFIVIISLFSLFVLACGSSDVSGINSNMAQSNYSQAEGLGFDGVSPLRVSTDGLGIAMSPVARMAESDGDAWNLDLESNRPIEELLAYEVNGESIRLQITDDYHAVLSLNSEQMGRVLARQSLYLDIQVRGGERLSYTAVVNLQPRVVKAEGSMLIWLDEALSSALVNREVRFAGFATTASRISDLNVVTDNDADPQTSSLGRTRWSYSWTIADMLRALEAEGDNLHVLGRDDSDAEHRVEAKLGIVVEGLGLTTGQAVQVWPADVCQVEVQRCLNTLPRRDTQDTSDCGNAAQVLACN